MGLDFSPDTSLPSTRGLTESSPGDEGQMNHNLTNWTRLGCRWCSNREQSLPCSWTPGLWSGI